MKTLIPLVDLQAQYATIRGEIDAAMRSVLETGAFINGPEVQRFEQEFAAACGAPACVGVANGTDALYLALRALGLQPGDEVITTPHTFTATAEAIVLVGARPVFVDIQPGTLLLDPEAVEQAVTPRTRAILAVHLYGQPCDMEGLNTVARRHGLRVVEDAAQAHGARWRGTRVGTLGDVACFSFYPGKNLGAYGDAGAVVSRDPEIVAKVRLLANHGRTEKYVHQVAGVNSRLDSLQAAVLRVKLRHLEDWNRARRAHAALYRQALQGSGMEPVTVHPDAESACHLFVVRAAQRDALMARLRAEGIEAGVHYPLPLHQQPAFRDSALPPLPVAERAAQEVLSLPLYPELTDTQREHVMTTLRRAS